MKLYPVTLDRCHVGLIDFLSEILYITSKMKGRMSVSMSEHQVFDKGI